jgi:beta-phosphoglucomutase
MILDLANIKAVIFDMDGVLFLSGDCHERAWIETLNEAGIRKFSYSKFTGMRTKEAFKKIYSENGRELPDDELERLIKVKQTRGWQYLIDEGKVADHSDQLLHNLSQKYRLALASSAAAKTVEIYLGKSHNRDIFEFCLNGSSVAEAKPSPEIYLLAAERLGVKPSECIVIEDAVNGICAGVSAGMTVVAVKGTDKPKNLRSAGATHVAPHLKKVESLLIKQEQ